MCLLVRQSYTLLCEQTTLRQDMQPGVKARGPIQTHIQKAPEPSKLPGCLDI